MLSCREAGRMISQRIDAELPVDLDPTLDAHLEGCALCRTLLKNDRTTSTRLREAMAVPEDVLGDLVASVGPALRAVETGLADRRAVTLRRGVLFGGGGRMALATAASFVFGAVVWFAVFAPRASDGGPPQSVLILEEHEVRSEMLPVPDGPPVKVWRHRKVVDEVEPPKEGGRVTIELDEYRNDLIQPVSGGWH